MNIITGLKPTVGSLFIQVSTSVYLHSPDTVV